MKVSIEGSDAFVDHASVVQTDFGWTLLIESTAKAYLLAVPERSEIPVSLRFDVVPWSWEHNVGSEPAGLVVCTPESMIERRALLNATRRAFTLDGRRMKQHLVIPGKSAPDQAEAQALG